MHEGRRSTRKLDTLVPVVPRKSFSPFSEGNVTWPFPLPAQPGTAVSVVARLDQTCALSTCASD